MKLRKTTRVFAVLGLLLGGALVLIGWHSSPFRAAAPPGHGFLDPAEAHAAGQQQYTCSMHPFVLQDEPGNCPICGMELVPVKAAGREAAQKAEPQKSAGKGKIKYWVAPMDPTYIRDKPGKSPMGMDLVPVYEGEAAGGTEIAIDPVTIQNMGIRTAKVRREDLARTIRTVGLVAYAEPRQFSVNAKISGWIEKLHVNRSGQEVKKGQPLLEIYSPDLVAAQEEFLLALHSRKRLAGSAFPEVAAGGERLLAASRARLRLWDVSEAQIEELARRGVVRKTMTLHSPYRGVVTAKKVQEGQFVKAGQELFQIADLSEVWVYADIYEYELPWVRVGQAAKVILPYGDNETLPGKVTYIYPYLESKTRTVKARLEFANPGLKLRPDMYVNVRIQSEPRHGVLTVPGEAVLHSGETETVFVALGNGKFEPRQVKTGVTGGDGRVEIVQGLLAGEEVVTSAQFMLDSESRLREAIQKMIEARKGKARAPSRQDAAGQAPEGAAKPSAKEDLEGLFQ